MNNQQMKKYRSIMLAAAIIALISAIPFLGRIINLFGAGLAIALLVLSIIALAAARKANLPKSGPILGIVASSINILAVGASLAHTLIVLRRFGFGEHFTTYTRNPIWAVQAFIGFGAWILLIIATIFLFIQFSKAGKLLKNEE